MIFFSPFGTEWEAETYEEALEAERDALHSEVARLRAGLRSLKGEVADGPRIRHTTYYVLNPRVDRILEGP